MSTTVSPGIVQLQSAAMTGNGGILSVLGHSNGITIVLQSTGTTSGGTVTIEHAYYDVNGPAYTGTWSQVALVNASDFTGTAQKIFHYPGSFWAIRTRVSSDITGGGSVSSWGWGWVNN